MAGIEDPTTREPFSDPPLTASAVGLDGAIEMTTVPPLEIDEEHDDPFLPGNTRMRSGTIFDFDDLPHSEASPRRRRSTIHRFKGLSDSLDMNGTPTSSAPGRSTGSARPASAHPEPVTVEAHRLRKAVLEQLTDRLGDHFHVLEQVGLRAPLMRDFHTYEALREYLTECAKLFRGFGASDRRAHDQSSAAGESTQSESDTESCTSCGGSGPGVLWIDVQTEDDSVIANVLSLFGRLQSIDDLLELDAVDTAHWFAQQRYFYANIECLSRTTSDRPRFFDLESIELVTMTVLATTDVLLTIHAKPVAGYFDALTALNEVATLRRLATGARNAGHHSPHARQRVALKVGVMLATLIEEVVLATLPDPTSAVAEADRIDEMVLLVTRDQRDLLRRIARVRRVLSGHRAALYRKERLVQALLAPTVRSTFIGIVAAEQYRHLLAETNRVAERLDAARDMLTQANSNFVSNISLQVAQTSSKMSLKMKALSQVTTTCLPLGIIAGMMGMNVTVPFNTTDYPDTVVPFLVIVGAMVVFVSVGIPLIWCGARPWNDSLQLGTVDED